MLDLIGRFLDWEPVMKKVYLASSYGRREELEKLIPDLQRVRMVSVARWLHGGEDGLSRRDVAVLDAEDVDRADVLIVFTHERHAPVGGGHLWEFGYAYGRGKRCVVIGPESTVFVRSPGVEQYATWEEFLLAEEDRWS
jgi:nucleoside 2-deoxyribosyltransferase